MEAFALLSGLLFAPFCKFLVIMYRFLLRIRRILLIKGKYMKKSTLLFSLIAMVLSGCNSVLNAPTEVKKPVYQIEHTDPAWQQHLKQLAEIKNYEVKGQFGYISPTERFSAHFDWQYKTPIDFTLALSSNLSTKLLKLQRSHQGLTVSDSEGYSRTEADIHALMQEIIGVSFPIDQFAYWVKGQPAQEGNYIVNEKRQLSQFSYPINQQIWQARYVEYHENRVPYLPKLIVLENGQQTLKIRLDHWNY